MANERNKIEKQWRLLDSAPKEFFEEFKKFPRPLVQLFWNRGLKTEKEINSFLSADENVFHSPFLMKNMKIAAERMVEAIKKNERIAVYSDYDADGACAAAIIIRAFRRFNFSNFDVFIPSRFNDGYGLTETKVRQIAALGVKVMTTFDCGITDVNEVALAKKLGIEVLIFDHHLAKEILPDAIIVDPHQPGDEYPFKGLSGTGVAYKLVQALCDVLEYPFKNSLDNEIIELAAIATVADLMPVLDENRSLIKSGLERLAKTENIGLKALMNISGLDKKAGVSCRDCGFVIGPRLNAPGRIKHKTSDGHFEIAVFSYELLVAENENEALAWAVKLEELNKERISQVQDIFDEIDLEIKAGKFKDKFILAGSPKWSKGTVGVAASRLREEFNRPVFVYSEIDGICFGSCRSIPQVNLADLFQKGKDLFIEAGGHAMSGGFSIKKEKIGELEEFLKREFSFIDSDSFVPFLEIESELFASEITAEFWSLYKKFEPFGKNNEEPVFLMRRARVENVRPVANGRYLKLSIFKDGKIFEIISFSDPNRYPFLTRGSEIDLVFSLRENEWQGRSYLEFELLSARLPEL